MLGNYHDFIKLKKLPNFIICIVVKLGFSQVIVNPNNFF